MSDRPPTTPPTSATTTDGERDDDERRVVFWEAAGHAFRPYAGWAFYGAGAVLVLIGWIGISGESIVAKQLPYLISGGIGGILLAVLGAYFLGIEELRRDSGRLDRMERQVEELYNALLDRPDAPKPSVDVGVVGTDASLNGHVVVEAGESYHRAECSLVEGKDATAIDTAAAQAAGLRPCSVCEPVTA